MRRVALILGAAVLVLLVAAQLVLPGIAERRVREALEGVAAVSDVEVDSFPAVKLLFGEIDLLAARLEQSDSTQSDIAALVARTERIDKLRAEAGRARVSGLYLSDARLVKDGDRIGADATVTLAQLQAVAPTGTQVDRVSSTDGASLRVDGSFTVLGARIPGPARVSPAGGAIVLAPEGGLLSSLAQVTVFRDDRLQVTGLRAREEGDRIRLGADALLVPG